MGGGGGGGAALDASSSLSFGSEGVFVDLVDSGTGSGTGSGNCSEAGSAGICCGSASTMAGSGDDGDASAGSEGWALEGGGGDDVVAVTTWSLVCAFALAAVFLFFAGGMTGD